MKIDRHNYEEYFILYMDNELDSGDRRMVEDFIQKNPDLKEELDILFQYKLVPDTDITFENKGQLLKQEDNSPVNLANYQEWLLLYLDNELTNEQKTGVDQFITNHPSAKEELAVLLKTKLQPEKIIFAGKESLYRREENPDNYRDRSIPVRWWRIAAAAALILFASITAIIVLNKKSSSGNKIAKASDKGQKTNTENPVVTNKEESKQSTRPLIANTIQPAVAPVSKQANRDVAVKLKTNDSNERQGKLSVPVKKEQPLIVENNQKPSNNLPQPLNNPNINNNASKVDVAIVNTAGEIKKPGIIPRTPVTIPNEQTYTNKKPEAVFANLEEGGNNKKNRGFLRKAVRFFEKKTNINATDDDDRLLVGGLAIKLK